MLYVTCQPLSCYVAALASGAAAAGEAGGVALRATGFALAGGDVAGLKDVRFTAASEGSVGSGPPPSTATAQFLGVVMTGPQE